MRSDRKASTVADLQMIDTLTSNVGGCVIEKTEESVGIDHHTSDNLTSNVDAHVIQALKREMVVYRHFVRAQVRCMHHVAAVQHGTKDPELVAIICDEIIASMNVLHRPRYEQGKRIVKLAKQLHVAAWVKSIHGAGMLNLGLIIGESGDLANYANPAKLWKRFGLHVMPDGKRARKFKDKALAEIAGYNPRRRAVMFVVGGSLIRGNSPYKKIYDERKAYELARAPEMAKAAAHARAQRYMEKRFLLHLWQAWRRTT